MGRFSARILAHPEHRVSRAKERGFSYPRYRFPSCPDLAATTFRPINQLGVYGPGAPSTKKEVPHRRASGMIPRETGRGLSISGAHRVAVVERLVGATLVVALLRTAPPPPGHCLGTTGPGEGWSGDSAGERCDPAGHPQGVPLRSSGIGPTGRLETALPVGDWKSPLLSYVVCSI